MERRGLHWGRGSKPNAWPVTIGELNASSFESVLQRLHGPLLELVSSLKSGNGIYRNLRCGSKFANTQTESRAGHPTLHWKKNHNVVLILVAGRDFLYILTVY